MKNILVLGSGAQGSTVARFLDKEMDGSMIICADKDQKAVDEIVKDLRNGKGILVDASCKKSIIAAARGVDLIVNGLPLQFGKNVLEAALAVKADYQDFAAAESIHEDWVQGIRIMYTEYSKRFKNAGRTAVIATGSAPGLICVAARNAMRYLDSCDTIYNMVYEGVEAKRFIPFWWSPVTALNDMSALACAFENGRLIKTEPFSDPIVRKYSYLNKEITFVEHDHDEPVHMGLNAKEYFKGAKNIYFKYAGTGIDFARPLYKAGLLSHIAVEVDGCRVVPFNVVLKHLPPAPKYRDEIKEILEEGLISDEGAMVVEASGIKDKKRVKVTTHVFSPGLAESYKRAGITSEMYITGYSGAIFTKMFIEGKYTQKGLISSDMLTLDQVDYYLECAKNLGITLDVEVEEI
jgi:saccharopine dehydrogenase (NAD+, L-lysine-forming)